MKRELVDKLNKEQDNAVKNEIRALDYHLDLKLKKAALFDQKNTEKNEEEDYLDSRFKEIKRGKLHKRTVSPDDLRAEHDAKIEKIKNQVIDCRELLVNYNQDDEDMWKASLSDHQKFVMKFKGPEYE